MNAEWAMRKLAPLMPNKGRRWQHLRDTLPEKQRAMLDQEIIGTAYRTFGNPREHILLSLPPEKLATGALKLGAIQYGTPKWQAGLRLSEALQNIAIFGRSGAGKTNVVFQLLLELHARRIPFIFLDWKRTARHLLPLLPKLQVFTPGRDLSPFPFNPFVAPDGLETRVYWGHVLDVLGDAYTLGEGAKSLLQRALYNHSREKKSVTVDSLLITLSNMKVVGRAGGWQISAVRALESVKFAGIGTDTTAQNQHELTRTLTARSSVLELDALTHPAKKFLVPLLSLWLFQHQLAQATREKLQLVLVVEEAHHLLLKSHSARESLMNTLLRQCREVGIGMIVVDQHPSKISTAALGNCYTTITLNLKNPSDTRIALGLNTLPDTDKYVFNKLPVGHAIVKLQDRWREPFLVRFPLTPLKKGTITDNRLRARTTTGSARNPDMAAETEHVRHVRPTDTPLDEGDFAFIRDVLTHPYSGVRERYRRLNWSADKGTRAKERLIRIGILNTTTVRQDRTRKTLLSVTPSAKHSLGLTEHAARTESLEHAYWKHHFAQKYREQDYTVTIEAPRPPPATGHTDILATKDNHTIAIEIETGKSNATHNTQQNLLAGHNEIRVIVTTPVALRHIDAAHAKQSLLIPRRVRINVAK